MFDFLGIFLKSRDESIEYVENKETVSTQLTLKCNYSSSPAFNEKRARLEQNDALADSNFISSNPREEISTELTLGIGCNPKKILERAVPSTKINLGFGIIEPHHQDYNHNDDKDMDDENGVVSCTLEEPTKPLEDGKNSNLLVEPNERLNKWKIVKKIVKSDLDQQSRLRLPKEAVKTYVIPQLNEDIIEDINSINGWDVSVYDENTDTLHELDFKMWPSTKSYVFNRGWVKQFAHRRELKIGDEIGLYWDASRQRFVFSILNRHHSKASSCSSA